MALSKETVKKLRIVEKAILAQPQFYEQGAWVSEISSCGTTCCIAGWVDFIFNGKKVHEERAKRLKEAFLFEAEDEWTSVAREGLGLDGGWRLFADSIEWPEPFCNGYEDAKTPKQRAKVAAARIEHFIATDGAE